MSARAPEARCELRRTRSESKDGYTFDASQDTWQLNKDVTVSLGHAAELPEPTQGGFRATLQRYAEEMSAMHTFNMAQRFKQFLRDTGATTVEPAALLNWRAMLEESEQYHLGALKGFLIAWHDYGFEGVSNEVVDLLEGWRIKGNIKGAAVSSGCPDSGPYTDIEMSLILEWANRAVTTQAIPFRDYTYLLCLAMTARRAVQLAALRGKDLIRENRDGAWRHRIVIPRAKQRGVGFRGEFRSLAVNEDLYLVLQGQHRRSIVAVEKQLGRSVMDDGLLQEIPIFINDRALMKIVSLEALREALLGQRPDALHETTAALGDALRSCGRKSTARSERTGEFIRLTATRFRHTRGTKLRREGFGAFVVAELMDHSDIQNVRVYTDNTPQEAVVINQMIGPRLAPFAQACMGTLVRSESEAIRGDDPKSRVPNAEQHAVGTCGNYGFCASGYRACYTCRFFQPWVFGPHEEVLEELYAEKAAAQAAGCAEEVVNADDLLILAVEHCVLRCQQMRTEDALVVEQVRG